MRIISITEMRRNAKAVLSELVKTQKPVAILQRSKPIAYLVDADTFHKLQLQQSDEHLLDARKSSLQRIAELRATNSTAAAKGKDSLTLLQGLREGRQDYE